MKYKETTFVYDIDDCRCIVEREEKSKDFCDYSYSYFIPLKSNRLDWKTLKRTHKTYYSDAEV